MPNITFLTNQSISGSTNVGRILPLAKAVAATQRVALVVHASAGTMPSIENLEIYVSGKDPFRRSEHGKERLHGAALIFRMLSNVVSGVRTLHRTKPEILIISKALPEGVAIAWLYTWAHKNVRVIFDVDDFELTANTLTSSLQRAAIAWAERVGARMAHTIVVATPFLQDHFSQLRPNATIEYIPTGVAKAQLAANYQPTKNHILYFGSVSIGSGHRVDLLPTLFALVRQEISDATLTVAGDGDDIATLKEQFKSRNLQDAVTWMGRFVPSDIPTLLSQASIVVDPIDASLTNRAKSSSRTVMAAASGIPIITSNIGIRADIIPGALQSRFFASPDDPHEYAARIIDVLRSPLQPAEKEILQSNGVRYTWDTLAEQYKQLLV